MSRKPITAFQLFKFLLSLALYLFASLAWFFIAIPGLLDSSSELDLIGGAFGVCLWAITTACLYLHITTSKPDNDK